MSPCETRIVAHLETARDRHVSAWDLAYATGVKDDQCVRVLIHRLRHLRGVGIESRAAPVGGYRLTEIAQAIRAYRPTPAKVDAA